uniref:JmjC domain-containing protein n=1 Tax=Mucochytrium quahogii TaxID=96639 RepID=A0A7S2SNL1_9STRA|mmetsp:Transcript_16236/g.28006  ORF Transcript_16236/g.28006 Transcript_16236/m.28006 type:complete len:387 (-) Transcript_16236:2531-3691(-)|eukprot:CAMPEP_0203750874 /NCGR_PEP_ID=MMETSP0098-20131031/5038_1 /ASSEMBLY_ACC=CAM_ASM_000208 /TAXON_ID=96639 /ORGANISM=" , Strain NY0313808BC1" /LENGTH=386 /DNA_ID=CAMNT_0050640351 /DNA_START=415 /DNA_END=1575 /DNA_ORIENTATION=+
MKTDYHRLIHRHGINGKRNAAWTSRRLKYLYAVGVSIFTLVLLFLVYRKHGGEVKRVNGASLEAQYPAYDDGNETEPPRLKPDELPHIAMKDMIDYSGMFEDEDSFRNAPIIRVLPESKTRRYRDIVLQHERYYRAHETRLYVPKLKKDYQITLDEFVEKFRKQGQPVIIPFESLRSMNFTMKPYTISELQTIYPNTMRKSYKYGKAAVSYIDLGPAIASLARDRKLVKGKEGRNFPRKLKFTLNAVKKLDFQRPPLFNNQRTMLGSLWFGSTTATTPNHCDCCDNVAIMVTGTKRWTVAPPSESRIVKPTNCTGGLCWANLENPNRPKNNFEKKMANSYQMFIFDLLPGEMLYLPAGWFHHVENLTPTIMTNYWARGGPAFLADA